MSYTVQDFAGTYAVTHCDETSDTVPQDSTITIATAGTDRASVLIVPPVAQQALSNTTAQPIDAIFVDGRLIPADFLNVASFETISLKVDNSQRFLYAVTRREGVVGTWCASLTSLTTDGGHPLDFFIRSWTVQASSGFAPGREETIHIRPDPLNPNRVHVDIGEFAQAQAIFDGHVLQATGPDFLFFEMAVFRDDEGRQVLYGVSLGGDPEEAGVWGAEQDPGGEVEPKGRPGAGKAP